MTPKNALFAKSGSVLAIDPCLVRDRDLLTRAGVALNRATKVQGKTRKMGNIPLAQLQENTYKAVTECLAGTGKNQPVEQPLPVQQQTPVEQPLPVQQQTPVEQPLPVQQQTPLEQPLPVQQQTPVEQPLPVQQQTPVEQPLPVQQQTTVEPTTPPAESTTPVKPTQPEPKTSQNSSSCFMQTPVSGKGHKRKQPDLDVLIPIPVQTDNTDNILCGKCKKKGRSGLHWIQCEFCDTWYHSACQGLSSRCIKSDDFKNRTLTCC